ncbi:MAG: DUF333 domain-containing protein [Candidatus Altiarchaeota archaeon]
MRTKYVLSLVSLLFFAATASAVIHPTNEYCSRLGYEYAQNITPRGVVGMCVMPDGSMCSMGDFARGTCGIKYNYCSLKGYKSKYLTNNREVCKVISRSDCTVCILPDGSDMESLTLSFNDPELGPYPDLNDLVNETLPPILQPQTTNSQPITTLSLPISSCGNGNCDSGETADGCPTDCQNGGLNIPGIIAMVIVVLLLLFFAISSKRKHKQEYPLEDGHDELDQLPKE